MMPGRFSRLFCLFALLVPALHAETPTPPHYQFFGGYSWLSNSYNGVPGAHQPLNGWEAALELPSWHDLRFKLDLSGYDGTNQGAPQHSYFILAGGHYTHRFGRESPFVEGLLGNGHLGNNWTGGQIYDNIASFSTVVSGGLDSPLTRRIAFRVQGGFQYTNFTVAQDLPSGAPQLTEIHGLPNFFGRLSTGFVWKF